MESKIKSFAKGLVLAVSLLASSTIAATPAQAITFALSQGAFELNNFSQRPNSTETDSDTDSLAISADGSAVAIAEADAEFVVEPPNAFNFFLADASGITGEYLALAESEASVLGQFLVNAGETFSFDFAGFLDLLVFAELPQEEAAATGSIVFELFDITNAAAPLLLDFFALEIGLTTSENGDFFLFDSSENVVLTEEETDFGEGLGGEEFAFAGFSGSLSRQFESTTQLALVERKEGITSVSAPEPSNLLAILVVCGSGYAVWKRRSNGSRLS